MPHPAIIGDYDSPPEREAIRVHRHPSRHVPRRSYAQWELARFRASNLPCAQPTKAAPGSEEKIRVLSERYAAGLPAWHPGDAIEQTAEFFDEPETDEYDEIDE